MIGKFCIGDIVRDADGIEREITGASVYYKFGDGDTRTEDELELVFKTDMDERLVQTMCRKLEISYKQLCSKSRKRDYVLRRQVISYILRRKYKWSYKHIGDKINRKHCTVLYQVDCCEALLSINDAQIKQLYNKIK